MYLYTITARYVVVYPCTHIHMYSVYNRKRREEKRKKGKIETKKSISDFGAMSWYHIGLYEKLLSLFCESFWGGSWERINKAFTYSHRKIRDLEKKEKRKETQWKNKIRI